jgi:hypothetical protein
MITSTLLSCGRRWYLPAVETKRMVVQGWIHSSLVCSATAWPWSAIVEWMQAGHVACMQVCMQRPSNLDHLQGRLLYSTPKCGQTMVLLDVSTRIDGFARDDVSRLFGCEALVGCGPATEGTARQVCTGRLTAGDGNELTMKEGSQCNTYARVGHRARYLDAVVRVPM